MGYYKPNNYNRRHYTPQGNRGSQYYRYGGKRRSSHPEHVVRNSMYGALACILALGFAAMWWGLAARSTAAIVIGIIATSFAAVSSVATHIKCLIKYKRYKERYNA